MKKRKDGLYKLSKTVEVAGVKKRLYFYGHTNKECQQKYEEYIRSQDNTQILFVDAYKQYCKVEESRIKYSEFKTKCERIEAFTGIMNAKLCAITPQSIALDLNKIARKNPTTGKPTSKRTLERYLHAVSNVFEYAEENRITTYNPTKYVKVPADAPQIKREALSAKEYKSILANPDPALFQIKLLILCGFRKSEAAALQWKDIDTDNGVISIYKTFDYKTKMMQMRTKSKAGNRDIPIPSMIIDELKEKKSKSKPSDFVFEKATGGMHSLNSWNKLVAKATKITGVEFTLHQLRHTTATIYYYAGIPVKECQQYMGHSNVRITLDIYTSLEKSDRVKNSSISKLDEFLA